VAERHVTLRDVAQVLGVSAGTVSRALRDDPRISPATRARVARAAEQLGYVPNAVARSLAVRASSILGLVIPNVTDPLHGQIVTAFEQRAVAAGYTVILASGLGDPAREQRALRLFAAQRVDGVALVGSILDQRTVQALVEPTPAVSVAGEHLALASPRASSPRGSVRVDDAAGMQAAVRHLLAVGRARIAYVGGPNVASNVIRREAAAQALRQALGDGRLRAFAGDWDVWRAPGPLAARIAAERPQALLCFDDKLAIALLDALRDHGLQVPRDLAVVGFDDIPFAALSNPRLTTVARPAAEMGRLAVEMLLEALASGEPPPSRTLPVRLVVRESSAPAARAVDTPPRA